MNLRHPQRTSLDPYQRVFYVAKFIEAIYVLHAFEKRTGRTAKSDVDLARDRLSLLLDQRARRKG